MPPAFPVRQPVLLRSGSPTRRSAPTGAPAVAGERAGGLRAFVVSGVTWKLVSQAIGMAVNFGTTLVLVRFLVPRDFGVAAMVIVFGSLGMLIANVGLGAALVQREELTEQDRSTAFWTSSAIGLLLTLVAFAAAGPVSRLF